jgi:hypothetical protein
MFSAGYQHGSRASCSSPSTDSPKQRKRKPAVKERRLELAVQLRCLIAATTTTAAGSRARRLPCIYAAP